MKLSKEMFIQKTKESFEKIGLNIVEDKFEKLYLYKELLIEWNEKINLTAITDDEEIIQKHFVDSAYALKVIENGSSIIDVGTGAGLPGVVLAICNDSYKVTLLDALQKRVVFLNEVITKLGLKNTIAVHSRAEEAGRKEEFREKYDIVISRAVASLNILMELTTPFVKVNGYCIYMKADKLQEEMKCSKNAEKQLHLKLDNIKEYAINLTDSVLQHNLAIYLKTEKLPEKYPRQFAKIKKNPL